MSEDLYFRLGERLNQYQVKILLVEPYLNILREIYSEEEAALGAELPMGSLSAAELGERLGREEGALAILLERMADRGTVFVTKTEEGVSQYALMPFVPGVVEFQLMRGTDTPRDRKVARMLHEFMEGEMKDLTKEVMKDPEVAKRMMPDAPARTITVEAELPRGTRIYPFEKLTELVDKESTFAAAKCYCRHHAYLIDQPCKVEGVPEYSCLMFGKAADFIVDRKFGKRVTKKEAYAILEATEKAGLVHNTNNWIENTGFICNCCGCCCGFLKMVKEYDSSAWLESANFQVQAEFEECVGCGDCIDRCQMDALCLKEEVISIDFSRCIGCGNCVTVCPTGCLSMVRRSEKSPPEGGNALKALGI
jgi:formate hydrogenlyase subunit 6/NADH:ubiquinone oxidoreductase subunit I